MIPRPSLRAAFILAFAPVVILLALSLLFWSLADPLLRKLDFAMPPYLHAFATPVLTRILLAFTWLGALRTVVPAVALSMGWLLALRRRRAAGLLGVAMVGALILNEVLKMIFHRARPVPAWSFAGLGAPPEHTFSFPSGHAFFATVLYGMLACLALHRNGSALKGIGFVAVAMFMPLAIGLSRIYFGMHNPTDVLAGYLAGVLWLAAVQLAEAAIVRPRSSAPSPRLRARSDRPVHP